MATNLIIDGVLQEGNSLSLEVTSPGLAYGFGLFESVKFKRQRPCFFDEHFDRLQRAAVKAKIGFNYTLDEMRQQAIRLFEANLLDEGVFKIVVSSGWKTSQVAVFVRNVGLEGANDPIRLRASNVTKASNAFTSRHKTLNYMENWLELLLRDGTSLPMVKQIQYILVDEYQDTNHVQANILDCLSLGHRNLMVVGDDAQSIYSWRGADFRNILEFPERFNATLFRMEQNYRSTPEILNTATFDRSAGFFD